MCDVSQFVRVCYMLASSGRWEQLGVFLNIMVFLVFINNAEDDDSVEVRFRVGPAIPK